MTTVPTPHITNVSSREDARRKHVLLVAHEPEFRGYLRDALVEASSGVIIHEAFSVEEAATFVFGPGDSSPEKVLACDWLDLIVISSDLPLPGIGGLVRKLKENATCSVVPMVVISREEVIGMKALYSVGCNSFIQLPEPVTETCDDLRIVAQYWLCANVAPGDRRRSN